MGLTIHRVCAAALLAAVGLFTAGARAGDAAKADDAPASASDKPAGDADKAGEPASGEAAPADGAAAPVGGEAPAQADAVADAAAGNSAAELPGKTYRFIGLRYRGIIVPKFIENLFAEGGRTVYVNGIGPEFAIRKDGFEYNLSAWLTFYNLDDTGFKGKSDPAQAWEIISAKMQILYLTADFLWSHEFTPEIALNYGLGAGFGFVFGGLHRNQSYPTALGQDPNNYAKCPGPGFANAGISTGYCGVGTSPGGGDNTHFGGYTEPSWANGGSKPNIFPWLALQSGLRFKPARNIALRLDLGFGISGFFFGLGGDYGL